LRHPSISGEIIISTDTAQRQAASYQTTCQREILLYVIHGILHLLGFNDQSQEELKEMRRKERQWMHLLQVL